MLEICGIPQALATIACSTCDAANPVAGTTFRGIYIFDDLDAPTKFSIRNPLTGINTWVTLTSGNVDGPVLLQPGDCITFEVDDNCNISH